MEEKIEIDYTHLYGEEVLDLPWIQKLWGIRGEDFAQIKGGVRSEMEKLGLLGETWNSRKSRSPLRMLERKVAQWLPRDLKYGRSPVLPAFHGFNTILNLAEHIHWEHHHQGAMVESEATSGNVGVPTERSKAGLREASKEKRAKDPEALKKPVGAYKEDKGTDARPQGIAAVQSSRNEGTESVTAAERQSAGVPSVQASAPQQVKEASTAPTESSVVDSAIGTPVESTAIPSAAPVLSKMVQIRRYSGTAVLYHPRLLTTASLAPVNPTLLDVAVEELNRLAVRVLDFDPEREQIVYETSGLHDIWVKDDAVLRAVLEEMILLRAPRFSFTIKEVHG